MSGARLSGPDRPGVHINAPGNLRFSRVMASINRPGLRANCGASTNAIIAGLRSLANKSGSWRILCHDTGSKSPVSAFSPASASSREGGKTCPIDAAYCGLLTSLSNGSNPARPVIVIVEGSAESVWQLKGATLTSRSISPSSKTKPGVKETGALRSPRAHNLAIL